MIMACSAHTRRRRLFTVIARVIRYRAVKTPYFQCFFMKPCRKLLVRKNSLIQKTCEAYNESNILTIGAIVLPSLLALHMAVTERLNLNFNKSGKTLLKAR